MRFAARDGPWKTILEGNFQGHEIEIATSPEAAMLVSIFEKKGEEITGMVLQAFSVFSAVGEAETFLESLQKEAIALSRHDGKRTIQFLALASSPAYSKASDEEPAKAIDALLKELEASSKKASSVAESFELQLTPLGKCSSAVKQAFFSQPAIIPLLVREREAISLEKEEAAVQSSETGHAVILGMTKDGKQVKEPLQLFQRAIVSDGTIEQRSSFVQIIIESYLLANIPAVVVEEGNMFSGMAHPTTKTAELQSQGLHIEAIGFPTKEFYPGKNLKVNINLVNSGGFLSLFGCNDKIVEKAMQKALEKGKVEKIHELISRIESMTQEEMENQYLKRRAERIVGLADMTYPEMFAGENNLDEMIKSWFGKIGKVSMVHTDGLDPRILTFLLDSLSQEIALKAASMGETGRPKALFAVSNAEKAFSIKSNPVQTNFVKTLAEMKRFNVAVTIATEKRNDLSKELMQIGETKISIIRENDVAVDLPNSKNYRLLPRPTISQSKTSA